MFLLFIIVSLSLCSLDDVYFLLLHFYVTFLCVCVFLICVCVCVCVSVCVLVYVCMC